MEAKRQLDLLDKELATKPYIAGDDYTIADIAIWSWYGRSAQDKVWDRAGIFLNVKEYKHLQAWTEKIANRPAVKRGLEVNYMKLMIMKRRRCAFFLMVQTWYTKGWNKKYRKKHMEFTKLSNRLDLVASFVPAGARLLDVGVTMFICQSPSYKKVRLRLLLLVKW